MLRILKFVGILVATILLVLFLTFAYHNRAKTIDFSELLPPTLQVCGGTIDSQHPRYEYLANWFADNTDGWRSSPASFGSELVYRSDEIKVIVLEKGIVVNYMADDEWDQVRSPASDTAGFKPCQ